MVMPSPFERLLQQVAKQAETDPAAAFSQLDSLYGKSLTDLDVRNLAGFAAHLGGAGLGRWPETIEFLQHCLEHDGLDDDDSRRSVWRALAVMFTCAGQETEAVDAIAAGVRTTAEHCRVCALTAQTLAARKRLGEAVTHLDQATTLLTEVDSRDEVVAQVTMIAQNLGRLAETRLNSASKLLLAASRATVAAMKHSNSAQNRHKSLFQHGRALALAGQPAAALAMVQQMLQLEQEMQAGPVEQFFSAALACRAQIVRGQFKIAEQALAACETFAAEAEGDSRELMIKQGRELKTLMAEAQAAIAG